MNSQPASLDFWLTPDTVITSVQGGWSGYLTLENGSGRLHIHVRATDSAEAVRVLTDLSVEAGVLAGRFALDEVTG